MADFTGFLAIGDLDASGAFTEMSGRGYARQAITLRANPDGVVRNVETVQFPVITGTAYPLLKAYAVFEAAVGGAYVLAWENTRRPDLPLQVGSRLRIEPGRFEFTFPRPKVNASAVLYCSPLFFASAGLAVLPGFGAAIVVVTASRALAESDNGKVLRVESAAAVTLTVLSSLPEGFNVGVTQYGAGAVTFAAGAGVTKRSAVSATNKQYGLASVFVPKAAEFILSGDVA